MKKLLSLLTIAFACLFTACHEEIEPDDKPDGAYGRTVLVYMAMQNSLGVGGSSAYHKMDSTEIVNAMSLIPKGDCMLLFMDDRLNPRLYQLHKGLMQPTLVKRWDNDLNSANPNTLKEVITLMRDRFGAEDYGIVLASHASGWIPAQDPWRGTTKNAGLPPVPTSGQPFKTFGVDVTNDGNMSVDNGPAGSIPEQMDIDDMAKAIQESGVHFRYMLFDACLMQNIEVAYSLRNVTDYVIGSPISISAEGAYYTDLVHFGLFSSDPIDVARTYADYYLGRGTIPYTDNYGTVISAIETSKMDAFAQTMRRLLNELTDNRGKMEKIEYFKKQSMSDAKYYLPYRSHSSYRPHFYDLISAFKALGASADQMNRLINAVNDVVPYRDSNASYWIDVNSRIWGYRPEDPDAWCGVSVFIPQNVYTTNANNCIFGDLNQDYTLTAWFNAVY